MAPIETVVTGGDSSTAVVDVVTIPATELADLQARAGASSQNFERLKKANETNEEYATRIELLEAELARNAQDGSGGVADERVTKLETEVRGLTTELAMGKVLEAYPVIKGKEADFEAYRQLPENAGMSLATAAKAFVVDKGLVETKRPGLEPPTGGGHAPVSSGKLTAEQAAEFRNRDYRGYVAALKRGDVQIEG